MAATMYYHDKRNIDHVDKKWVRVITVITYVISVSIVALVLGLYYKLGWHPKYDFETKKSAKAAIGATILNEIGINNAHMLGSIVIQNKEHTVNSLIIFF
jgi:hypothetical protein